MLRKFQNTDVTRAHGSHLSVPKLVIKVNVSNMAAVMLSLSFLNASQDFNSVLLRIMQ